MRTTHRSGKRLAVRVVRWCKRAVRVLALHAALVRKYAIVHNAIRPSSFACSNSDNRYFFIHIYYPCSPLKPHRGQHTRYINTSEIGTIVDTGKSIILLYLYRTHSFPSVRPFSGPVRGNSLSYRLALLRQTVVPSAITSGDTIGYQTFDVSVHTSLIRLTLRHQRYIQWIGINEARRKGALCGVTRAWHSFARRYLTLAAAPQIMKQVHTESSG